MLVMAHPKYKIIFNHYSTRDTMQT